MYSIGVGPSVGKLDDGSDLGPTAICVLKGLRVRGDVVGMQAKDPSSDWDSRTVREMCNPRPHRPL